MKVIRILSWNIQWARGTDGRVDPGRTARTIRAFDADVVCLQEVAVNHPGLPGGPVGDQVVHLLPLFGDGVPGLRDAWCLVHPGQPNAPTAGVHGAGWLAEPGCCDFFFVGENLSAGLRDLSVDGSCQASDHQPVLLELNA